MLLFWPPPPDLFTPFISPVGRQGSPGCLLGWEPQQGLAPVRLTTARCARRPVPVPSRLSARRTGLFLAPLLA